MASQNNKFIPWILISVSVMLTATSVIATASIFGDDSDSPSTGISKLASSVAVKLGIDESVVAKAINEARSELAKERAENKLSSMVTKGWLTEEQAGRRIQALESSGYDLHNFRGSVFAKKSHLPNRPLDLSFIEERMNNLVKMGSLTQEQADRKMTWIESKVRDDKTYKKRWGKEHNRPVKERGNKHWNKKSD